MHYRDMGGAPPDTNISKVLKMTYDNFTAAALTTNVQAQKALANVRYATVFAVAFIYYLTVFTYRYLDSRFDFKAQLAKAVGHLAPEADSDLGALVVEVVEATQAAEAVVTQTFSPVYYTDFSRESLMEMAINLGHSPRKNASRKTLLRLIETAPESTPED